ncbi:MAG: hypothetical protein U1F77_17560 [Kiritimatiellia bacterium]
MVAVAARGNTKAVSLVTSFDTRGGDVREAAVRLARESVAAPAAELIARHEAGWAEFWAASGVRLDDPDFQRWWYRMLYYLRACTAPHAQPIGLYAGSWSDAAPGTATSITTTISGSPTGPLQRQPSGDVGSDDRLHEPDAPAPDVAGEGDLRMRRACVGISSFLFEPDPAACKSKNRRQVAMVPWGYTMGMIGMSAQVLWHRHLFDPDPVRLRDKIYPVLKEAALFFCSFVRSAGRPPAARCGSAPASTPSTAVSAWPMSLRHRLRPLHPQGRHHRRGRTAVRRGPGPPLARRAPAPAGLPDRPRRRGAAGGRGLDRCKFRQVGQHNITVPAVPVFPGEQVTAFSPAAEQDLFRNTLRQTRHTGLNSIVMFNVAQARLSMPEALDQSRAYLKTLECPNGMFVPSCGPLVEIAGVAAMVSEFLLQSVDNTLRVFPCWPKERDARFTRLRAQGGFLVTAEQKSGRIVTVEIISTVGGKLRVLDPWTGRIAEFDTRPNQTIRMTP